MRQENILKLNQKPHSAYSVVALVMAVVAFLLAISGIVTSVMADGARFMEIVSGVLEWLSVMLTVGGIVVALVAESIKETDHLFAHMALGIQVILIAYHGAVLWFGYMG